MLRLVEQDHGEEKVLIEGTLEEIVKYLKENENITNWVLDEDPEIELPELGEIETLRELEYELKKVDLSWWTLEVEEI